MGIGEHHPIVDPKTGKPTVLSCGSWFCMGCNKLLKVIHYPFTETINKPCSCGSTHVYKLD